MKLYVIAGEASGDLHGSNLMKALKQQYSTCDFRFWGGDKMQKVTEKKPVKHIKELAFMGFIEVLANLRTILKNISYCKQDIESFQPDALILIDYPGFNLRIAEWAKARGVKVLYYISPQIWAWKQGRVHKIKKVVDKMYCILPFEKDFYKKFDVDVDFVGHPLIDAIEEFRTVLFDKEQFYKDEQLSDLPIIALLPGSRKQEIEKKLPIMLNAAKSFSSDYQLIVAGAPSLDLLFYASVLKGEKNVRIVQNKTYELLSSSTAALVTSGTATLETALFNVPEVVCYKGSPISYWIAKRLIKVRFISLVNLIMDREVVCELIQDECNVNRVTEELRAVLPHGTKREAVLNDYSKLIESLGGAGASSETAKRMLKTIQG